MLKILQWFGWSDGSRGDDRRTVPNADLAHRGLNSVSLNPPVATSEAPCSNKDNDKSATLDANRLQQSSVDIAAASKVMAILEEQLQNVTSDVEKSVVGVCQGFQGMTERAQSAINLAQNAVRLSDNGKDGDLVQQMQQVLETLIENVRASSNFSKEVSQKLLHLESRLQVIESTVEEVEEISARAQVVALNGQIEASRLGAQGRAFAVVAEETKVLAVNAAKTSDAIRNSISQLSQELHQTSNSIRIHATENAENYNLCESSAKQVLQEIHASNHRITQSLNQTVAIGGELRTDIAKAVMSMQFQDRVSQRISHVVEALEILTKHMTPWCEDVSDRSAEKRSSEWMREIQARYTMDSERSIHPAKSASETSSSEDFSVELF